ncbi:TonB-dependent receptor [Chitinophaga eiseniae]|uniref:TonB-dependent receptor n=1 Tax=Chitinophaga eiseniae TaxID=634771 RepID=A0A847STF5_9BACT|nr:TonB-dependent receptor [Chitinophaga eiseniae]NLR79632.1 TonB-dependent receptor [Chitinophaga eiseniae]
MNVRSTHLRTSVFGKQICLVLLLLSLYGSISAQQKSAVVQELHVSAGPLTSALGLLRQQSGANIMYDANLLKLLTVKAQDFRGQSVEEVLRHLLKGSGFSFSTTEGVFIIKKEKATVPVTGTVTDEETGARLPGVSVLVKGNTQGSITNGDGAFTLQADPHGDTLLFSSLGYKAGRQVLNGQQQVTIRLKSDASMLNSVVVVGYGQTTKGDLTGAVSHVSSENFNTGVFSSPEQLLQGKVPGLNVTRSGDPNATPAVILRGPSTFREGEAQQPFYVIDGVPGANIQLVSPADILSMDVLKDAASTAIYGARAANGVIMITTRRAKQGQSWISYNAYAASERISNKIDMLSANELRQYLKDNNKSLTPAYEDNANTDWQKEVTRNGMSQSHNLSFGGGNEKTLFDGSINYLQNNGIIKTSSLERLNVRANLEQRAFNDVLKINLSISNSLSTQNRAPEQVYLNMLNYIPTVNIFNPDGTYKEDLSRSRGYLNPVSLIDNNSDRTKEKIMLGNARAELKLLPELRYTMSLSLQDQQINRDIYNNRASSLSPNTNGQATRSAFTNSRKVLESYFNYDKTFGKHDLRLLAGYSWQEDRTGDGFQTSQQGFVSDVTGGNNLNLGGAKDGYLPNYGTTRIQTLRFISFYGRVNYLYEDKYLLQVSVRRDGSSAFGINNRWGTFPAVSGAWKISKEKFMDNVRWIEELKLRAGYGVTGNSLGFDPLIAKFRNDIFGKFYSDGRIISSIGPVQNDNPNLKWERTGMANIGIDLTVWKGRLSVTADYYDKRTTDLIYSYEVPSPPYFVPNMLANVGAMSNKGIELQVNVVPVKTANFTWNTSANIAHNKNRVVSLSNDMFSVKYIETADLGGKGQSGNKSQLIQAGYALGAFYLWQYEGKDKDGNSTFRSANGGITKEPSSTDRYYSGDAQPAIIYGWSNSFTFRQFDASIFIRGVSGNKILNATLANLNNPAEATGYDMPRITLGEAVTDAKAPYISTRYLENGSYLRLDNVTIGYTIPVPGKYVRKLRVYATGNNLALITKYKGIDPEINMGGLTPGIDNNNFYPKTRSFLFGLNATF